MLTPLTRRTQSATALPWCRRLIPPCYVTEGRLTPISLLATSLHGM